MNKTETLIKKCFPFCYRHWTCDGNYILVARAARRFVREENKGKLRLVAASDYDYLPEMRGKKQIGVVPVRKQTCRGCAGQFVDAECRHPSINKRSCWHVKNNPAPAGKG